MKAGGTTGDKKEKQLDESGHHYLHKEESAQCDGGHIMEDNCTKRSGPTKVGAMMGDETPGQRSSHDTERYLSIEKLFTDGHVSPTELYMDPTGSQYTFRHSVDLKISIV